MTFNNIHHQSPLQSGNQVSTLSNRRDMRNMIDLWIFFSIHGNAALKKKKIKFLFYHNTCTCVRAVFFFLLPGNKGFFATLAKARPVSSVLQPLIVFVILSINSKTNCNALPFFLQWQLQYRRRNLPTKVVWSLGSSLCWASLLLLLSSLWCITAGAAVPSNSRHSDLITWRMS